MLIPCKSILGSLFCNVLQLIPDRIGNFFPQKMGKNLQFSVLIIKTLGGENERERGFIVNEGPLLK